MKTICANCDRTYENGEDSVDELVLSRVMPGDEYPAGECECGGLTYPEDGIGAQRDAAGHIAATAWRKLGERDARILQLENALQAFIDEIPKQFRSGIPVVRTVDQGRWLDLARNARRLLKDDVSIGADSENAPTAFPARSEPYNDEPAWIEGLARTLLNAKRATDRKAADWIRNGETR